MMNNRQWRCLTCDTLNEAGTTECKNCGVDAPDSFDNLEKETVTKKKAVRKRAATVKKTADKQPATGELDIDPSSANESVENWAEADSSEMQETPDDRFDTDYTYQTEPAEESPKPNKPKRQSKLPKKAGRRRSVGLIGFSGSGKTVYLSMLYHATAESSGHFAPDWQSRWNHGDNGRTVRYLREQSNKIRGIDALGKTLYQDKERTRIRRDWPEGTVKQTHLKFSLIKQLGLAQLTIDVNTLDVAGEVLQQVVTLGTDQLTASSRARWDEITTLCRSSDGLIIFISLLSFEDTRDEGNIRLLIELLEQGGALPTKVALVVTGADLCTSDAERDAALVRVKQRYDRVFDMLELAGVTTDCYLVSSIGQRMTRKKTGNLAGSCKGEGHICPLCQELSDAPGVEPEPTNLAAPWEFFIREFTPKAMRSPFVAQSINLLSVGLHKVTRPVSLLLVLLIIGCALFGREYMQVRQAAAIVSMIDEDGFPTISTDEFLEAHKKRETSLLGNILSPVGEDERRIASDLQALVALEADLQDERIPMQERLQRLEAFTDPSTGNPFAARISNIEIAAELVHQSLGSNAVTPLEKLVILDAIQSRTHPLLPELHELPLEKIFNNIHRLFRKRIETIETRNFFRNHEPEVAAGELEEANQILQKLKSFGQTDESRTARIAVENYIYSLTLAINLRSITSPPPTRVVDLQQNIQRLEDFIERHHTHPLSEFAAEEMVQFKRALVVMQEEKAYRSLPQLPDSADSLMERDPLFAAEARRDLLRNLPDFLRRATIENEIAQLERMARARTAWFPISSEVPHVRSAAHAERLLGEIQTFLEMYGDSLLQTKAESAKNRLLGFSAQREENERAQLMALPPLPDPATDMSRYDFTEAITARLHFLADGPSSIIANEAEEQINKLRLLRQQIDRYHTLSVNTRPMWSAANRNQAIIELDAYINEFPASTLMNSVLRQRAILVDWTPVRPSYRISSIEQRQGLDNHRLELIITERRPASPQVHLNIFPELPLGNPAETESNTFDFRWDRLFPVVFTVRIFDRRAMTFSEPIEIEMDATQYPSLLQRPLDFGPVRIYLTPYRP